MKNGKKKLLLPFTAAACALLLAGCGTSVGEHTDTYFSQMGNVIKTAIDSSRAEKEADSGPTQTAVSYTHLLNPHQNICLWETVRRIIPVIIIQSQNHKAVQ